MTEEGWGLKDALIFIAVMCVAILISMVIYSRSLGELFDSSGGVADMSNETYSDIEVDIAKTARTYINNYYYKVLEDGDSGYITIRDMQGEKLLTNIKDIKNNNINCSGYVYFHKNEGVTRYKTYLKCGDNYQTTGYSETHDESVKVYK